MQRTKPAVAAALIGFAMHAAAQDLAAAASQPQPGYGFAPTVKKLLQLEADKAVEAALGQTGGSAPSAAAPQAPAPTVQPAVEVPPEPRPLLTLDGIYGRGGRWTAEVAIDGRIYAFMPAETKAGYTAKRIDARCIELQHNKFPQKLCSDR